MSSGMGESGNRQRLRPWLEAKINSGQFPGLEWVDKSHAVFKIPWKHGGKQDWSESDSLIFKEWAVHTGRYRDGIDQPDWPSWKTRLRCALNKLPDIQEIKDMSNLDGSNPFRVYRFLPKKGQENNPQPEVTYRHADNRVNGEHRQRMEPSHELPSNIPKTVAETISGECESGPRAGSLGSDLKGLDYQDLLTHGNWPAQNGAHTHVPKEEEMDTGDNLVIDETPYTTDPYTGAPSTHLPMHRLNPVNTSQHQLLMVTKSTTEPDLHEMVIKLKYRHTEVAGHHVRNPHGCRLFYGNTMDMSQPIQGEMYGSASLEQLHFPVCESLIENQKQRELTTQLLNVLERGLLLETENGDIYATRKCRLVIFVSQPDYPPIKLNRASPRVKVFDYQNYFLPALQRAMEGRGPPPVSQFLIGFGQDWRTEKEPYNNLLISATVFHARAHQQLSQLPEGILVSNSDEYDKYLENFKELALGHQL